MPFTPTNVPTNNPDSNDPLLRSVPPSLMAWLTCTTYMMERLQAQSGNTSLTVHRESWEPANPWDQRVLHLGDEQILHRDIVVTAWEHPCWFARTILPRTTYAAHLSLFARLKQEPLGNLIFHTQFIQRLNFAYYSIEPGSYEYSWLPRTLTLEKKRLWMRCSTFQVKALELFCLVEISLPDLERYS